MRNDSVYGWVMQATTNTRRRIDNRITYRTVTGLAAVGLHDTTRHDTIADYDADCSACWLGHGHTTAYHAAKVR